MAATAAARQSSGHWARAIVAAGAAAASAAIWGATTPVATAKEEETATPLPPPPPSPPQLDLSTLRLVQVVFRHGARTPLSSRTHLYDHVDWTGVCAPTGSPADHVQLDLKHLSNGDGNGDTKTDAPGSSSASPASDADAKQRATILKGGCCHKGELTILGKEQARQLGAWLRERYGDGFLPAAYRPGVVSARTTNYSRTRATLRGVLAGLWPELAQPGAPAVPATTSSDLDEILFADSRACGHLQALLEASVPLFDEKREREKARVEKAQKALDELLRLPEGYWSSGKGGGRWAITDVHDVATSLPAHGRPLVAAAPGGAVDGAEGGEGKEAPPLKSLPRWLEDEVNRLATAEFSHFVAPSLRDAHGHTVLRLSMGRLLDQLLARMDEAVEAAAAAGKGGAGSSSSSSSPPLIRLFSGHDSTVLPLLVAVGGRDVVRWPPYCSHVVLELHEAAPSQWFVRVLFNKEPLPVGKGKGNGDDDDNPHHHHHHAVPLEAFRREVVAPFLLSDDDHRLACTRPLTHDGPLPQPEEEPKVEKKQQQQAGGGGK